MAQRQRQRARHAVPGVAPRHAALTAIAAVLGDGQALTTDFETLDDARDRALARALAFGVLRWHALLEARLAGYLRKPLKRRDADIGWLLELGLFQLGWLDLPAYAAIDATVEVTRRLDKPWAAGLVNGVLRAYQRDETPTIAPEGTPAAAAAAHPTWLHDALAEAWPDDLAAVLAANNAPGPLWLRVRGGRDAAIASLAAAGHEALPSPHARQALRLTTPCDVEALPGFGDGRLSVQDAAAQLAADLVDAQPGERVLDACAAPGGKTAHLLERTQAIALTAVDSDGGRAQRIRDTLSRLQLTAEVRVADARHLGGGDETWHRILLDAPCSGSGVIRRHPDIKWLRRAEDLPALAKTQGELLRALWARLELGGRLVYATCSILPAENDAVIGAFLESCADEAQRPVVRPIEASWGRATRHGRHILPGEDHMDGFYYAVLDKP